MFVNLLYREGVVYYVGWGWGGGGVACLCTVVAVVLVSVKNVVCLCLFVLPIFFVGLLGLVSFLG